MTTSGNAVTPLFALVAIAAVIGGANAKPPSRIWGGRLAIENEFSAAVTLSNPGNFVHACGAAIIGPRHVLTAAHCVDKRTSDQISVRAGIHDIRDVKHAVEKLVSKVIIHPDYISYIKNERPVRNDLALLVLKDALTIGGRIQSFRLPQHQPEVGVSYFAAGWGINDPNPKTYQFELKTITMTLLEENKCNGHGSEVICAVADGGTVCGGDSGSPFMRGGYLYGIASTSNCVIGEPAHFVNVWHYIDWINEKISLNP